MRDPASRMAAAPCKPDRHARVQSSPHSSNDAAHLKSCTSLQFALGPSAHCGPRTARELWKAASPLGLAQRTHYRGRQELAVRTHRVHRDNQVLNCWLLPDQRVPEPPASEPPVEDLEEWLSPLCHKYSPSIPLDEM